MQRNTVYEYWREFKTQKKPPFIKLQGGKRDRELLFELALIFPNNRWVTATWVKDSLGRNQEAIIENDKFRIKEIIPYWQEELIYDFETKKRIRYHRRTLRNGQNRQPYLHQVQRKTQERNFRIGGKTVEPQPHEF